MNNDHLPRKFLDYTKKDGGEMQYFYKSCPVHVSANELSNHSPKCHPHTLSEI